MAQYYIVYFDLLLFMTRLYEYAVILSILYGIEHSTILLYMFIHVLYMCMVQVDFVDDTNHLRLL